MKLESYLEKHKISRSEFADLVDADASTVSRWITGVRRPEWSVMARIRDATGGAVMPNDFLGDERCEGEGTPLETV